VELRPQVWSSGLRCGAPAYGGSQNFWKVKFHPRSTKFFHFCAAGNNFENFARPSTKCPSTLTIRK